MESIRDLIKTGYMLAFEPAQLDGSRPPYRILSIDGQMVKVSTPEGFRLLPLVFLSTCHAENRLRVFTGDM